MQLLLGRWCASGATLFCHSHGYFYFTFILPWNCFGSYRSSLIIACCFTNDRCDIYYWSTCTIVNCIEERFTPGKSHIRCIRVSMSVPSGGMYVLNPKPESEMSIIIFLLILNPLVIPDHSWHSFSNHNGIRCSSTENHLALLATYKSRILTTVFQVQCASYFSNSHVCLTSLLPVNFLLSLWMALSIVARSSQIRILSSLVNFSAWQCLVVHDPLLGNNKESKSHKG